MVGKTSVGKSLRGYHRTFMPSARMEAATLRPTSPNPRMRQVFPAKSNMGRGCGRCPGGAGMPRGVQSWRLRACAYLRRCVYMPCVSICMSVCAGLHVSLPPSFFPRLPVSLFVEFVCALCVCVCVCACVCACVLACARTGELRQQG